MAKVRNVTTLPTEGVSPTRQIIESSAPQFEVVDKKGRRLVVRKPSALQKLNLMEALGDSANNRMYFMHAMLAASVIEIDGERVPFPQTKMQVQALVQRLDDEGMDAAADAFVKIAEGQASGDEAVALAKN